MLLDHQTGLEAGIGNEDEIGLADIANRLLWHDRDPAVTDGRFAVERRRYDVEARLWCRADAHVEQHTGEAEYLEGRNSGGGAAVVQKEYRHSSHRLIPLRSANLSCPVAEKPSARGIFVGKATLSCRFRHLVVARP